ncbi:MAG: peptidylprolyl isomerase [Acidobacteriota bacterium]|nr:peptidylprolyl isomerase [Acidobacteriota bacterium]
MSKKSLIFILILIIAVGGGVFVWRVQNARATDEKVESEILKSLTAEEIKLVLKSNATDDDSGVAGIAENAETRRAFLKGMREYLALAADARREGLTEDENFKINYEIKKNLLLADLYKAKLSREQGKNYIVPKEETEAVWTNPANAKQFETDMETLQTIQKAVARERGDNAAFSKLQGGSLIKARENWARTKILSERAKADAEFMAKPEVSLRIKIVEAGILSADYLRKHWVKSVRATEREIADYLAARPEYDVGKKREKAETLLRRVQSGEDFSRLAAEFSEDRTTKNKGGLYENIEKDSLWAEVERAALALENDQIAGRLIETETGWHIVKLENKQIGKKGETVKYSVRHILLQKNFAEPNSGNPDIPSPFLKAEEIAKAEIEKEKRNKFVESIIERSKIILPDDFTVELPTATTEKTENTFTK